MILLSLIITCSQAFSLVTRITNVVGLTPQQKMEIIKEMRKVVRNTAAKYHCENELDRIQEKLLNFLHNQR
jgi:hypothetical protein